MEVYLIFGFVILLFTSIISYGIGWYKGEKDTLKNLFDKNVINEKNYNKFTKKN